MKYELISNVPRAILKDRTPILQDTRDTFAVSFLLPDDGAYLAILCDENGIEYRKSINDGQIKIPKELLSKEQYIEVIVCKIDNDTILETWICEPLKITAFLNMRQTQWQISGGMTDKDCFERLVECDRMIVANKDKIAELTQESEQLKQNFCFLLEVSKQQQEQIDALIMALNNPIGV